MYKRQALELLSIQISTDSALAKMRLNDPAPLALGLAKTDTPLWSSMVDALAAITGSQVLADCALRWLIGQMLQPLTPEDSRLQAELLISRANI